MHGIIVLGKKMTHLGFLIIKVQPFIRITLRSYQRRFALDYAWHDMTRPPMVKEWLNLMVLYRV